MAGQKRLHMIVDNAFYRWLRLHQLDQVREADCFVCWQNLCACVCVRVFVCVCVCASLCVLISHTHTHTHTHTRTHPHTHTHTHTHLNLSSHLQEKLARAYMMLSHNQNVLLMMVLKEWHRAAGTLAVKHDKVCVFGCMSKFVCVFVCVQLNACFYACVCSHSRACVCVCVCVCAPN